MKIIAYTSFVKMSEERIEELEAELKLAREELDKLNNDDAKSEVSFASNYSSDTDGSVYRTVKKSKKKKSVKERDKDHSSLKNLLAKHQFILKEIGKHTLEDTNMEKTKSLLNSLSKSQVNQAVKNHKLGRHQDSLIPPEIENNSAAESSKHRDAVGTLRDMFKTQFSGKTEEDLESLLFAAGRLAEEGKLSKEQFFNLIKSRTQMGSNLYVELRFHEENESTLKQTYAELLPVYGRQSSYIQCLSRLNYYKPAQNAAANEIFANIKKLATDLASSAKPTNTSNFVYNRIKDKILVLYPFMATTLVEREQMEGLNNTATLSRIFIQLVPAYTKQKGSSSTVLEISSVEDISDTEEKPETTVHVIRLSENVVNRLKNKCYKCAAEDHFGRDCQLYKDCQMAYYLCSSCKIGVHLPKDCKQTPKENKVNLVTEDNVRIQVLSETKNEFWG